MRIDRRRVLHYSLNMAHPALSASPYSLRNLGRSLEQVVRQFRSYLVPSHIWTYWKTVLNIPLRRRRDVRLSV